ncbi:MAG: DUF2156 domain-containing protein [Synergistaceae bacterium]|nr:DUF2156 domain-containing protein [Synergistaceae bacterium]
MLSFKLLTKEDKDAYTERYRRCPVHMAEYSFFGLWGWKDTVPIDVAFDGDLCWLRSKGPMPGIFGPVGDWSGVDWEETMGRHFAPGDVIYDVPKEAVDLFPDGLKRKMRLTEERDQWEYVYSVQELIALKGSKYAHKRNRVRAFLSNYDWEYLPMLPDDFPAVLDLQERWRAHREATMTEEEVVSLHHEELFIRAALEAWDDFPFLGGILKADDELVAYTIAEELDERTLDIRFEKAMGDYAGSYQAINQLFLKEQGAGYEWVDREEDMGEPGLRAAKMSYCPVRMLEKYRVEIIA